MDKLDFRKDLAPLYAPKNTDWELIEVPAMNFLMVDGKGDPNTSADYSDAVVALYGVSYTIKFMSKQRLGKDYGVAPLEGLWWADDPAAFENARKSEYQWTMMIMQPDWITETLVSEAVAATAAKKELPALLKVRFERYDEGRSLQLLHVGSYDDEAPKLKYLHAEFMPLHQLTFDGRHHEIYLSDPRKTVSSKLKTIVPTSEEPVKAHLTGALIPRAGGAPTATATSVACVCDHSREKDLKTLGGARSPAPPSNVQGEVRPQLG